MSIVEMSTIEDQVQCLFAMVSEGIAAVTSAFLSGDREAARAVVAGDSSIDSLQTSTEALLEIELQRAGERTHAETKRLVAALRIVPELERSGDLVEHIALRTPQHLADHLSARARGIIAEMGRIGTEMWRLAADAYAERDSSAAERLRSRDDELDELHVDLSAELAATDMSVAVAIEMGLIARFYERLGDHAVNVSRRI